MNVSQTQPVQVSPQLIFLGAVFGLGSLGIDSMLPSLGIVAQNLHLANVNKARCMPPGHSVRCLRTP